MDAKSGKTLIAGQKNKCINWKSIKSSIVSETDFLSLATQKTVFSLAATDQNNEQLKSCDLLVPKVKDKIFEPEVNPDESIVS